MNAVVLDRIVKRYGRQLALNGLSLELPLGSVCALIGPNGSGKTTTMGVIAGLLQCESGSVNLLGQGPFSAAKHAGRISLMPQDATPSQHLRIGDILQYYAELQGLSATAAKREARTRLEQVNLLDRARSRFWELSHGMRRRFSVAQALLGKPELILLDEPTSGLDPELVVQIRELIMSHRGSATLLVSSHVLSELESMCDHAIFVEQGVVVRQGPMSQLTAVNRVVRYTLTRKPDLNELGLVLQACTITWLEPTLTVHAPESQPLETTNALCLGALLSQNVGILQVDSGQSLEEAYLAMKGRRPEPGSGTQTSSSGG